MLPDGQRLAYNLLLHGGLVRRGELVYEQHVIDGMRETLEFGGVFYDIGANIGVFSLLAAEIVGQKGFVFAFEPEENNLICLRRSIAANGQNSRSELWVACLLGGFLSGVTVGAGDCVFGAGEKEIFPRDVRFWAPPGGLSLRSGHGCAIVGCRGVAKGGVVGELGAGAVLSGRSLRQSPDPALCRQHQRHRVPGGRKADGLPPCMPHHAAGQSD